MRNSIIKVSILAAVLVGSAATLSAFAHENEDGGMMSSEGMGGMMQMMNMMSEMDPQERKAMTKACSNMMQSHGDHGMDGDTGAKADAS